MTFGAIQGMRASLNNNKRPKKKAFKAWKNKTSYSQKREKPLNYGKKSDAKLKKLKDKIARDKRSSFIKQLIILAVTISIVAVGFYFIFFC